MLKFLLHTLFLITAVFVAFFWTSNPVLSVYTLQLTAVFVLLFFASQFLARKKQKELSHTLDAVVFTMVVLLLVISTGGLTSPLFFLVYFLMFGLALLFEPLIAISLAVAMVLFFFATPTKQENMAELFQLFSLLLVTPLALFFSNQYLKLLESQEKIKILKEEAEIVEKQIEKEETDVLIWNALELRKCLTDILNELADLLADVGRLTVGQKEKLLKIRERAIQLLKSGQKLKEEVDQTTDEG